MSVNIYLPQKVLAAALWCSLIFTVAAMVTSGTMAAEKPGQKWTCPMHPHYISDEFGTCPICGMDLVEVKSDAGKHRNKNEAAQNGITISSHVIQKMGVRTAKVGPSRFGKQVRSFGRIAENERLQTVLSARVEGWIETLKITATGDQVAEGDLLFELFSPELIVSQRDFISALGQTRKAQSSIRRRLLSFGVQDAALDLIAKSRTVQQNLPFYAARHGTVSELNVSPGSYVRRGMTIAKIQDYSVVWVMVNVSEKDLSLIKVGTKASVYLPNLSGKVIKTTVDYIYPEVNEKTRTGRVRLVVENKDGLLRPGAYADVVFDTEVSERLSVPVEAILKDQSGDHVIMALGAGRFLSRVIEVGLVTGGQAEILSGLKAGDEVVISAQFLIDSESRLQETLQKLSARQKPLHALNLSKNDFASFDHIVDAALYLHETIVADMPFEGAYLDPAISVRQSLWADYKDSKLAEILIESEVALEAAKSAKTIDERRAALAALVKAIAPFLRNGAPQHYEAKGLFFYQSSSSDKLFWVQIKDKTENPYDETEPRLIKWPAIMKEVKPPPDNKKDERQDIRGSHHVH